MIQDWWQGREPRERVLIGVAGVLTVLVAIVFGVFQPLVKAKGDARQQLANAQLDMALVQRGVQNMSGSLSSGDGPRPAEDADQFRTSLTRSARENGLSIARLQSGPDGSLQITLDDADPKKLFAWLQTMNSEAGGHVLSASMSSRQGERVQAVIELQGASQ
ncbi:MAG: type II secretion system protein M [Pseudomonadota bacterium]